MLQYSESQRQVFGDHSIATRHLLPALMAIFIDIEFTGESMEFEDKFRKWTEQTTIVFIFELVIFRVQTSNVWSSGVPLDNSLL